MIKAIAFDLDNTLLDFMTFKKKTAKAAAKAAGVVFVAYANQSLAADFHIRRLQEVENILGNELAV